MIKIYAFLVGPMLWITFCIFIIGSIARLLQIFFLVLFKEKFIFSYMSFKYGLRSIFHWITPFAAHNMRTQPIMTLIGFLFHICLLLTPLFLLSHIILWDETWNLNWWALPDLLADIMSVFVILGCIFFLSRRLLKPEVRFVTSVSDYLFLILIATPFLTGLWANYQFPGYSYSLLLHIFSGEILLIAIPFTRLVHMVFAPLTRSYTGSEFGGVRHARDW